MTSKLILAAAMAALTISTAQAQPGNAGRIALAANGIAVEEAKVSIRFGFAHPYYRPHDGSPYYSPYYGAPDEGEYRHCRLGVCY
jgi:hypothetical protein